MRTLFFAALACLLINFSVCKDEAVKKRDKILCVVLYSSENKLEALSVLNSWARQCDKVLMVPDSDDETLPSALSVIHDDSMVPYQAVYEHIDQNYKNGFSWILMASWDSHLIMDNVRNILAKYQPTKAYYLGSKEGNNAFSSKCGTMMNMKALAVFQRKLTSVDKPDSKTPEAYIYETLKNNGVELVDFCSVAFKKAEIPESVDHFITRSSGMKKCCSQSCIAMKGASIYENFQIDRLIQNEEIAKMVNSKVKKSYEDVEKNVKKIADGLEREIRLCTDSAEKNSVNYTQVEWGKRWDAEWNSFCEANVS